MNKWFIVFFLSCYLLTEIISAYSNHTQWKIIQDNSYRIRKLEERLDIRGY